MSYDQFFQLFALSMNEDKKIFKEEQSNEMLKILCLIKNMIEQNLSQEFRLKSIE